MDPTNKIPPSDNCNPREAANIFSIATFFYNLQILRKGMKKDIEERDVYKVIPDYEAETLGDLLESKWRQENKLTKNASITKCLIKCFGWTYLFYGICQLAFSTGVILLSPTVLSKFVAYFQPNQTELTKKDAFYYAFAMIGLNLLQVLFNNNFQQLVVEYSIKVRTAVCSLIFRKALKLSPVAFAEISVGRIVTLMSKDVLFIDAGLTSLKELFIGFLQLAVVTYILYQKVGKSAFPAIGVLLVIIPIQLFAGKKNTEFRIKMEKKTDKRFKLLQKTLSAIKIIKMYSWQNYFEKLIHKARLQETNLMKILYYLKAFIGTLGASTINLAFYVLLISYIARGYTIDAETIYYVQSCLGAIRVSTSIYIPFGIVLNADMLAALQRIQQFLDADEVSITQRVPSKTPGLHLDQVQVTLNEKEVLKSVSLNIKQGLLLIAGNVGSGKSALIKTILGEFAIASGKMITEGTFSYASEDPWLFPSTIRQNILFGERFDEKRYQQVLNACALTYDINKFEKLDQTIVEDKGINLSKGQQARITLARTVYRESDIYLLDDCLSSLDNLVNKHIFNECIRGFLKDKICVLVTNNINNIKTVGNSNVLFIEKGCTLTLDQQQDALDKRITYYIDEDVDFNWKRFSKLSQLPENQRNMDDDEFVETDLLLESNGAVGNGNIQNLYHEDKMEGKVLWSNYVRYYRFTGGIFVAFYLFVVFLAAQFCVSYSEKLISLWVNLESEITRLTINNQTNTTEYNEAIESRKQFLNIYTILIVAIMVLFLLRAYSSFFFCMNGARKLHRFMIKAMLGTYMYFFDDHFIGNIINRISKDFHIIDDYLPFLLFECYRLIFYVTGVFVLVATVNWMFFIPAGVLCLMFYLMQRLYLPTGRSLRRLEATTRSPIIGYLNSTLEGLSIIRAAQQQSKLQSEFDRHQDLFTSTCYMIQTTMRFFTFILDMFGTLFLAAIIIKFIVFPQDAQAGDVGLSITQAMMLSALLQYAIKQVTEVENAMTSVERVLEYSDVTSELKVGKVPSNWPTKGCVRYNNVSLTYKSDGNTVLKNISFEIDGQSKVGIVGRTGAGKSSIISTLFRLYDFDGQIFIDNENINLLSLDCLRSVISIIPQDPILFSGSIRTNIDPFHKYADSEIWAVLEKVHLKPLITNLNQEINDVTSIYSCGQKQLICLARALLLDNKIMVLDEATASLDPETEQLLQKTFKECFKTCTVIIIAHKLSSVMDCDKVLVLDAGRVMEYDKPQKLLKNVNGFLFTMVKEENFVSVM